MLGRKARCKGASSVPRQPGAKKKEHLKRGSRVAWPSP